MNEGKLQYWRDICHGKPWRSRDDLIQTLKYMIEFHKSLVHDYFFPEKIYALAEEISCFLNSALREDSAFRSEISDYENLDANGKRAVISKIYEVLFRYAPELKIIRIVFEDKETKIKAWARWEEKEIIFFNAGTGNSGLEDIESTVRMCVHEFTHLLQDSGKSTIPLSIVESASNNYVSYVPFDMYKNDQEIKELHEEGWKNNVIEKEAMFVGEYCAEHLSEA
ncbi:MAG: hypothetical protein FWE50_01865 [Alphaproteobacteria bacterium]|nr:hypothetical protein [Alphaproteobacteria bacterium]